MAIKYFANNTEGDCECDFVARVSLTVATTRRTVDRLSTETNGEGKTEKT